MEGFLLLLITFGFILNAQSQNFPQQAQVVNPDYIYYTREEYAKPIDRQIKTPNRELQPPHKPLNLNVNPLSINNNAAVRPNLNVNPLSINNAAAKPNKLEQHLIKPSVVEKHSAEDERVQEQNVNQRVNKLQFDQAAAAMTNFSLSLMKNAIVQKPGNTVLSPYSITALLSLLQQGATDQALFQITQALQMTPQMSAATYKAHNLDFQSRSSRNTLRTANSIFLADAFSINSEFSAIAQTDFASDVAHTNFADSVRTADLINSWIAYKTNNKIDKLITPDALSANTQMVLVNAVYFKGFWEIPFRPQGTKPGTFYLSNRGSKTVPLMSTRRTFRAGVDKEMGSKVVILPFEREEYSMMIILPSSLVSVDDTFRSLTVTQLENYMNMTPVEVHLKLPKFSIRADTDLTLVLKQLGISKIFEQRSDLSGLGYYQTMTPQVSSAVHSAVLTIDEEGGSAAAATAFNVVALSNDSPTLIMHVDRPFIAVLWDSKTKVPLFMAKIEDPGL